MGDVGMWVNRKLFDMIVADNRAMIVQATNASVQHGIDAATITTLREQKAKDDITIDWMRHRINALEKEKGSLLVSKGIPVAVPEIVPGRPGTMSAPPSYDFMPSFEDVGDDKARELGIEHDPDGNIQFAMPEASHGKK